MSFNGIWVWDAKHGTPKNSDEVEAIKSQLLDVKENNPNMAKFAKFFGKFAEEAIEFYDDEAIRDSLGWGSEKTAEMPALHCFEELPLDCLEHFYGAILKGAKMNNLIVYEANSDEMTLPKSKKGDQMYANWKRHLAELKKPKPKPKKAEISLDDDKLPLQFTQVKKGIANLVKERASALVEHKVKNLSDGCAIDFGDIELRLSFAPAYDKSAIVDDVPQMIMCVYPNVQIVIKPFIHNFVNLIQVWGHTLYEDSKDETDITTWSELTKYIDKYMPMLELFYPHCESLDTLYTFLAQHADNRKIVESNSFYVLCGLAKITNQPNYNKLRQEYKSKYIDSRIEEKALSNRVVMEGDRSEYGNIFDERIELISEATEFMTKKALINKIAEEEPDTLDNIKPKIQAITAPEPYWVAFFDFPDDLPRVKMKIKYLPKGATFVLIAAYVDDKVKKAIAKVENCIVIEDES